MSAKKLRLTIEVGPKEKRFVAVAPDWPGLERGGKTAEGAIETLRSYLPRYAGVAALAGMEREFGTSTNLDVVERYPGIGSTDFWGISFAFSSIDHEKLSGKALAREVELMQACWAFFDNVRSRVSPEMRKGPRGGGRDRDVIVRHVLYTEQDWAKKVGVVTPEGKLVTDGPELTAYRSDLCDAIRAFHADGKRARTWPLRFLIRHAAFHTMDHAWEMEDKDLTGESGRK